MGLCTRETTLVKRSAFYCCLFIAILFWESVFKLIGRDLIRVVWEASELPGFQTIWNELKNADVGESMSIENVMAIPTPGKGWQLQRRTHVYIMMGGGGRSSSL